MDTSTALGVACLGITIFFLLFFFIGVRNCPSTNVSDFMVAGAVSMVPLFFSLCAFLI